MVYSFAVGCFIGFPFGCYLREMGYHRRIVAAYRTLVPKDESKFVYSH